MEVKEWVGLKSGINTEMRSANNVQLDIGARVAALDIHDSWIYPGIIDNIEGDVAHVTTDGGHKIPNVISSHIWVIDLFPDKPRGYWGYPNEFVNLLSRFPLPEYFNRSLPIRTFGKMLLQGMFLYVNNRVFDNKVPQPIWKISNIIAWAKVNKNHELYISTKTDTIRQLFLSVCHECVHLYQFANVTKFGPDDLLSGFHGSTFLEWRGPLSHIGVTLNPTDTSDTEAEIAPPQTRDKPHLIILIKYSGEPVWKGGIVNNEREGRMIANMYSVPGRLISLVWVRNVQITRALLPVKARRKLTRLGQIPDNVIAWIAQNGQAVRGFPLPDMPEPKVKTLDIQNEPLLNISPLLTNIDLHNQLIQDGFGFVDKMKSEPDTVGYIYAIPSPVAEGAQRLRRLLIHNGFKESDPSSFRLFSTDHPTSVPEYYYTRVFGIPPNKPVKFFLVIKKETYQKPRENKPKPSELEDTI